MNPLVRLLALVSLLLLPACGTQVDLDAPGVDPGLGFVFEVDPERGLVTQGPPGTPKAPSGLAAPAEGPQLVNDHLVLDSMNTWFVGDTMVLEAVFTNVSADDLAQPFSFVPNPATSNIVSSVEPEVSDADLGGDAVLSPGESTSVLRFEVRHRFEPFRYVVDAYAVVMVEPPEPEPVGRIAFVSDRDGNDEIYIMNADGTDPTNLTNNPLPDGNPYNAQVITSPGGPSWSPHGSQILFTRELPVNQAQAIYGMNADGSHPTLLSNPGWIEADSQPAWSPDGTKIAFRRYLEDEDATNIFVMNADGSNLRRLNQAAGYYDNHPAWSPDGTKIVISSDRSGPALDQGPPDIYVMNADGSNLTNLTSTPDEDDELPAWSPDGTKIAFVSNRDGNREIYVMNSDGTNQTRLTDSLEPDSTPVWSPDGTKIAFIRNHGRSWGYWMDYEIYVMTADGSNLTRLTDHPGNDNTPVWSPDGTRIAYVRVEDASENTSSEDWNYEVYLMNADGSNQTNLTNNPVADFAPAWQPLPR